MSDTPTPNTPAWVPPQVAVLVDIVSLGDELIAWNGDAFDGDGDVSGADAIEFLCGHRDRLRDVLATYRKTTLEVSDGR